MRPTFRLLLVLMCFVCWLPLRGQAVCGEEDPFLTPPDGKFCVDTSNFVLIEFNLTNDTDDAGDYIITFPDGVDSVYLGVVRRVKVTHTMAFTCSNPIGNPELPTKEDPYYSYKSKLIIQRTDCTDAEGKPRRGSYNFDVIPNPIQEIQVSDVTCRSAPYLVDLSAILCDADLVSEYAWFLDGQRIERADEQSVKDVLITKPGEHTIRLAVTTDSDKCPSFFFEKVINITPAPTINLDYTVEGALCAPVITIFTTVTAQNTDSYRWSSPSSDVTFSDPTTINPIITINNEEPGSRIIRLTASNQDCAPVSETFTIETFSGQTIRPREPLATCTNLPINLGDQLEYTPEPQEISWSTTDEAVRIDRPNTTSPEVTVSASGVYSLTATGVDVCGQAFTNTVEVRIRDGNPLTFDFSSIDTLCPTEAPIDLRDYVQNPGNLSTVVGRGVSGTTLNPGGLSGLVQVELSDSCGGVYPVEFFVLTQGVFAGGNPAICEGQTLDLNTIQTGTYSGTGVVDSRFVSAGLEQGTYTIQFESTTYCGGSGQFTVTVDPPVAASFSISTDSCDAAGPGGAVTVFRTSDVITLVNASSAPVISYTVLETGQEFLGQDSVGFTLDAPGRYTLEQVVGYPEAVCADTLRRSIEVRGPFDLTFGLAVDSSACDSLTYTFGARGETEGLTFDWAFSTGDSSEVSDPILRIARPVAEQVLRTTVVATNGCFAVQDTLFSAPPRRFQVAFGILNDNNTVCSGDTAFLVDNSVNANRLRVLLADGTETDRLPPFLVIQNNTKEIIAYPILVEGFNQTCPAQNATDTLYILPVTTQAAFSLIYEDDCSPARVGLVNLATPGASTFVQWGDGSTPQPVAGGDTVYHVYSVTRDTTFDIGMVSRLCGDDTFAKSFTARAGADAGFGVAPPDATCVGNELRFLPAARVENESLNWSFGDGSTSLLPEPTHRYDSVGDYRVFLQVTNQSGCTSVDSIDVRIDTYSGPPLSASIPTEICVDAPYGLDLSGFGTSITYDYGNNLRSDVPVERPYQQEGEYQLVLTATDALGCTVDTTARVTVYPRFGVFIDPVGESIPVELGSTLDLSFQMEPIRLLDSIRWVGDSLSTFNTQRTTAKPVEDGVYRLRVTDEYGCLATDSVRINVVKSYGDRVYVPNAFSPNGDGQNETFGIDVKPNTVRAIHTFRVISRWGAMVYECTDCAPGTAGTGWDGRVGSQPSKPDVYVWIADIEFTDGHREVFRGDVALLR